MCEIQTSSRKGPIEETDSVVLRNIQLHKYKEKDKFKDKFKDKDKDKDRRIPM